MPTWWRGRLVVAASNASVDAGQACRLARSGMLDDGRWCMHAACDPRDGAERLRTHPAARVAQLTASQNLLPLHNGSDAPRCAPLHCYSAATTLPRRLHLRTTLQYSHTHTQAILISTHNNTLNTPPDCQHQNSIITLLPRLQPMAVPDISPIISRSSR